MPKYDVTVVPFDGNAFSVMGAVKAGMQKAGAPKSEIDAYLKDAMSGDYDHLLQVSLAMVNIATADTSEDDDEDIEDDEDYCPECGEEWTYCDC